MLMRGPWLRALPLGLLMLLLPPIAPRLPQAAAAPHHAAPGTPAPATVPTIYRVKAGDTLGKIASRHRVTMGALLAANRLESASVLRVGQRLVIPGGSPAIARARRTPPAPAARRPALPPRTLVLALPDFSELTPPFAWPTDGRVSSTFGRRRAGWHRGIDIEADLGTPVAASAAGTVVLSGYETRYGRVVKIEHLNGFMTVYAHNDHNLVEAGERVRLGQLIAAVGRTGRATAHHVHFEIRQAGLAYNPLYMLPWPPRATFIEEPDDEDREDPDD
jgi:murein DD-endopeptidase MepM/ murein hydrolase activator NlpD